MKLAQEMWLEEQCETINEGFKHGNSKVAYDTLRKITQPTRPKISTIGDKHGKILNETTDIVKRWTEYCKELYNCKCNPDYTILENSELSNKK